MLDQTQFGISYISSLLKSHGHNTRLVVLSRVFGDRYKKIIDEFIKDFSPKLICFTAVSSEYNFIAEIGRYVKRKYPDIYLMIGGCHITLNPEEFQSSDFDAMCIGEGEYPTLELVSQLESGVEPSHISNLWLKNSDKIEKNPTRPFLNELDILPFPDRKMWFPWMQLQEGSRISLLLGRGCPFECTYCCNHALRKVAPGQYVRTRSAENIISEIKAITAVFPEKKEIYLEVESFGIDKKWAIDLCSHLEGLNETLDHPLSFGVNIRVVPRPDFEELFAELERANFKWVNIGLESGNERIRRSVLSRYYSNDDFIMTVNSARKHNIKVAFYNMIGLPGETLEDFQDTLKINRICQPDDHFTSIFYPYPGTKIFESLKEGGLSLRAMETGMERKEAFFDLPGFTKKQIIKNYQWFDFNVYKGKKRMYKLLLRVMAVKLTSNPRFNLAFRRIVGLPFLKRIRTVLKKI